MASAAGATSHSLHIAPLASGEDYANIVNNVEYQYNQHYVICRNGASEIARLTEEWEKRSVKELSQEELDENVATYIKYRKLRETAKRLLAVYNKAILDLKLPFFDTDTLKTLQKLKIIDIEQLQQSYNRVFKIDFEQIVTHRREILSMVDTIIPALTALRVALEPLAQHIQGYNTSSSWPAYQALKVCKQSSTPLVNALVNAREAAAALALAQQ